MTWLALAAACVAVGLVPPIRLPARRRPSRVGPAERIALARLLGVALSAGLPLPAALAEIAVLLPGPEGRAAEALVRRARLVGVASALTAGDDVLGGLTSRLARAHLSGASMHEAVRAFIREESDAVRAEALTRARTLPVKLLVPVSLFLLPGFLALVVVPPLLDEVSGILGPLLGP